MPNELGRPTFREAQDASRKAAAAKKKKAAEAKQKKAAEAKD